MKIFIDANIILDFYRSNNDAIAVFEELIKNSESIILTSQIVDEYFRNREVVLLGLKNKFTSEFKIDNFSSSFLQSLKYFQELNDIRDAYNKKRKEIERIINEIIDDPTKDDIAKHFLNLISSRGIVILNVTSDIVKLAQERKLRGNPPVSDKYSVGDEINWELLLTMNDNLIIVARDNTYVNNIHFLRREFNNKNDGKKIVVTDRITEALKIIGKVPSDEIVKIEEQQIEDLRLINGRWKVLSVDGNIATVTDGRLHGYTVLDTHLANYSFICPHCRNFGPWNGSRCLTCGHLSDGE